ncbi:MATH/TRAF domain-containing protein [Hirschfeldia incana]|nr:MATH/TRAF domain-containing protein [Hirschfeldia incana]
MWDQNPSFRFEIDNFSDKEAAIASREFVAGGCEWYLTVYPKGHNDHLSFYLEVANRESLQTGWKRCAKYYFRVLNESNKELYKTSVYGAKEGEVFCARDPAWGIHKSLPLSKFQEKGFLENDKIIIEVYIKVVEAFDGEGEDINGFQVFAAHVASVKKTFAEHVAKTEYKNTLINACSKLSELAEVGVKLDWLKSKFAEVSFKRKNADDGAADESLVQQLEERIKNLELIVSGLKKDCLKSKSKSKKSHAADECRFQKLEESVKNLELMELGLRLESLKSKLEGVSLETKKSHDAGESRAQLLEGRLKKIELMKTGSKLDSLKLKLDEIALERKDSYDAYEPRVQQLEERIENIELMDIGYKLDCVNTKLDTSDESLVQQLDERVKDLSRKVGFKLDCLNTTIEERSVERTKSDDARFQKLEESVKNIELMVSGLEVELDKKKDKSVAEGFLLVD